MEAFDESDMARSGDQTGNWSELGTADLDSEAAIAVDILAHWLVLVVLFDGLWWIEYI